MCGSCAEAEPRYHGALSTRRIQRWFLELTNRLAGAVDGDEVDAVEGAAGVDGAHQVTGDLHAGGDVHVGCLAALPVEVGDAVRAMLFALHEAALVGASVTNR